jgi:hypothetical protein
MPGNEVRLLANPAIRRLARQRKESALQAAVLAVLRGHGLIMWKLNREKAGPRYAPHVGFRGLPDLGGVIPGSGRACFVEVKRKGQVPSPHQVAALRMLAKAGAFVCLVHDVEEAQDAAKEAMRR